MYLFIFKAVVVIFIMWLLITQILIPGLKDTKIFPLFRREKQLTKDLEEVNQQIKEKVIEKKIAVTKVEEKVIEKEINDINKQKEGL